MDPHQLIRHTFRPGTSGTVWRSSSGPLQDWQTAILSAMLLTWTHWRSHLPRFHGGRDLQMLPRHLHRSVHDEMFCSPSDFCSLKKKLSFLVPELECRSVFENRICNAC